jgi:polar amino acid transport system substrate-binding protein
MRHTTTTRFRFGAALLAGGLGLTACGSSTPAPTTASTEAAEATTVAEGTTVAAAPTETTPGAAPAATGDCAKESLKLKTKGMLTFATSKPAFPPWVIDDTPTNKKGFESAVAYAVAETMGFTADQVKWEFGTFDQLIAPGTKNYDVALNQFSITEDRKKVVDFSRGYYKANQAIVAFEDSPAAKAKTLDDLKKLKFGAQTATTSLTYLTDVVKPSQEVFQYSDNAAAKSALAAKQIDAIVVDLPTAFYISGVEIEGSKVIGQFPTGEQGEEFGMVLEKDSPLTQCVSAALAAMDGSGSLKKITEQELSASTAVPFIR